jgi:ergosteryl-3beta-O-L-aspartate synthase
MALEEHYHETLEIIDGMFKRLWQKIYERYATEIEIISRYYPHQKVLWLEETPRIPFSEGIQMLIDDGWTDSEGNPPSEYEDLNTRAEIRLGQLVRERYRTDYYILDKFPTSARPFYVMPDPTNNKFTNSFDIFMRGQEILTGGQRIHDAKFLEKRMRDVGVAPETMEEYMEGFRWGAPPHAGAGIGLERLLYLFLNLGNIRLASLFPRDPRSLPERPRVARLRHPEASTTNPPWENDNIEDSNHIKRELQPLKKLIANYGDAANTSWLDDRYEVWRHESTGAAQGFVPYDRFAIVVGEPLCAKSQYPQVVSAFIHYLKTERKSLKPIWLLVGPSIEEYLGEKFGWRTLSAAAEERADPRDNPAWKDNDVARKIRHAKKEGIKNIDVPFNEPVAQDLKERIDARIHDWQRGRRGKQVHITEIRPWIDQEHRRYFYAADGNKEGRIHALIVLHQLAPENGYQVKFSLEFPDAPSGTIESLTLHAMSTIVSQDPDVKGVTFGTGAMEEITGGRNIGKHRLLALKKSYAAINKSLKLTNKSEFRAKLGAKDERVFVAYPKGGLGVMGIKAILGFLGTEEKQGADSA